MVVEGYTLLVTLEGNDEGGANNPAVGGNAAVATANAKHNTRVQRLHATLLLEVKPDSELFKELNNDYANLGIETWDRLREVHIEPLSYEDTQALEADWVQLALEKCRLNINKNTQYAWAALVAHEGNKLAKTNRQICDKFMDGNHPMLRERITDERQTPNVAYNYPANYPAGHPRAGQVHRPKRSA